MDSIKGLLYRIKDSSLSVDERASFRCELAKKLEQAWRFDAAVEALGELWQGVGERPVLEGLGDQTKGELLLRAGALTGWIGSLRQIEDAQEAAKNLITESIEIFASLKLSKKISEAQIDLAYCYWRQGAFDNARVWLQEALSRSGLDNEVRAVGVLRSAIVEESAKRLHDCLHICTDNAELFEQLTNPALRGKFHNEFGLVLKDLGVAEERPDYIDRALIQFTAASVYFELAKLARHQACVENNLGFLYGAIGNFKEAHEHLDRAQALFTTLKDRVHLAQVDETRARVLLAQRQLAQAEKFISRAVRDLEEGGEQSLLAEALTTQGTILAARSKYEQAHAALRRAAEVAEQVGDLESAGIALVTLIEKLGHRLSNEELCATVERAGTLLEKCRDFATIRRLERVDRQALFFTNAHPGPPEWSSFVLDEVQQRNECRYVELALKDSHGSVTKAAKLLSVRGHQSVNSKLRYLCPHLLSLRTPIKRRKRRIIQSNVASDSPDTKAAKIAKILLVEDDRTVAEMTQETLEEEGWQVDSCRDGNKALEKIVGSAHYDLLLLDDKLPGVDGIELVQRARQLTHRSRTPIIVVSATPGDAAARKAGADVFLPKPQVVSALVKTITRLLADREQED